MISRGLIALSKVAVAANSSFIASSIPSIEAICANCSCMNSIKKPLSMSRKYMNCAMAVSIAEHKYIVSRKNQAWA